MASYVYERLPEAEHPSINEEQESLLPTSTHERRPTISEKSSKLALFNFCQSDSSNKNNRSNSTSRLVTIALGAGFASGVLSVLFLQWIFPPAGAYGPRTQTPFHFHPPTAAQVSVFSFPEDIGATEIHEYPPPSPTNAIPDLFPTEIGFPGPTVTGAEAALIQTAANYPSWKGVDGLVRPKLWDRGSGQGPLEDLAGVVIVDIPDWIEDAPNTYGHPKKKKEKFDIFQHWGNLSPFYSAPPDSFGLSSSSAEVPSGCELKGVHILHRHGARYPTGRFEYSAPNKFAFKLHQAATAPNSTLAAHGALSFLNRWTYKLGTEVLTPFGRQQLFDLGVSMRMKYGSLLEGFTDRLPVFRTESQDRMLASATNFALGFFGWPLDDKFLLSVTVEADYFNNTLAPYKSCPNDWRHEIGERGTFYVKQWVHIYLKEAKKRIQGLLEGYTLTFEDVYTMQMLCPYETVALGYSSFCGLFTEAEWEGFEYALDLYFWYDSGFGSPVARALGSGYVLELLSRLTQTPIHQSPSPFTPHDPITPLTSNPSTFSVNLTLDSNPITFPLDQPLYVDATHEVVIVNILTALNLTSLIGGEGRLSGKKMRRDRTWFSSRVAPFAANVQFQLLTCPSSSSSTQIRVIVNDAPASLTGINGCPEQKDGMCPLDVFVASQKELVEGSDWDWTCHGNWTVPEGDDWWTLTGDPPAKD